MLPEDELSRLYADFVESQDYVQTAHDSYREDVFVCHHNSYLAHRFMVRRGHAALQWVNGIYRTSDPIKTIRHSWISSTLDDRVVIIFEFDPNQLHRSGNYLNDPMPAAPLNGPATIVDPAFVSVPDDLDRTRWILKSREVLDRYKPMPQLAPQLDFSHLDYIDANTQQYCEDTPF